MEKGKLIVIEGACDGIGKSTQYSMLKDYYEKNGIKVNTHHFPSYGETCAVLVEEYLKGNLGNKDELSPYFINSLYAIDRAITWENELKKCYENGEIILLDRYTTSSMIYQSTNIKDLKEKKEFLEYISQYEYDKLGIAAPDKVIFLKAPFDLVTKLRNARQNNEGIEKDIHERDLDFMKKVYDNSLFVADYFGWDIVECADNEEELLSREEIHEKVLKLVK